MLSRAPAQRLVFVLFCAFAGNSFAVGKGEDDDFENPDTPNATEMVVLAVDKNQLKAELMTLPDDPKNSAIIKKFKIAIGKEKGDKQKKGDNRTPEGIYMTKQILDGKNLPAKYGPNAITLNYPNPVDVSEGKTGYGIWLHGVINDERVEEANVTEGCVAFYNADIVELTRWLQPYQGFVLIAQDTQDVNRQEDITAIRELTQQWSDSWASRNLDRYISFYSDDFHHKGRSKDQYREYKGRVFASYKVMTVEMRNLRVMTHPKYAVSIMDQDFFGDERFTAKGRKILYWIRDNDNRWRIDREVFETRRLNFVNLNLPEKVKNSQASLNQLDETSPKL